MRMPLKRWARHYGVSYRTERLGLLRHRAVLSREGKTLRIGEFRIPFGPSLEEALRGTVARARVAGAFGGSFAAYVAHQARTKSREHYRRQFASSATAYGSLLRVLGDEATRSLLFGVKEFQ